MTLSPVELNRKLLVHADADTPDYSLHFAFGLRNEAARKPRRPRAWIGRIAGKRSANLRRVYASRSPEQEFTEWHFAVGGRAQANPVNSEPSGR